MSRMSPSAARGSIVISTLPIVVIASPNSAPGQDLLAAVADSVIYVGSDDKNHYAFH